jgi:hypothetical protein
MIAGSRLIDVSELMVMPHGSPSESSALTTATPVVNLPMLRRMSEGVGREKAGRVMIVSYALR